MEHQDTLRDWARGQVTSAAQHFAGTAVKALGQRFGHLIEKGGESPIPALGSFFQMTGEHLDTVNQTLEEARLTHRRLRRERRKATGRRKSAYQSLRREIRRVRLFLEGQAKMNPGVHGPTPRDPEVLVRWVEGLLFALLNTEFVVPSVACPLAEALVETLEPLQKELAEAIDEAALAWSDEKIAFAYLKEARQRHDDELAKVQKFLEASLELAGEDYLSRRVLGKRRGRPRKSEKRPSAPKENAVSLGQDEATPREIEIAPPMAVSTPEEIDLTAPVDVNLPKEIDSSPPASLPAASTEAKEIPAAPIKANTAVSEIEEASCTPCTGQEKITEAPCKPCTEPSEIAEVLIFQEDTPKKTRRRRRRTMSSLLGASARWLPTRLMGRLASDGKRGAVD